MVTTTVSFEKGARVLLLGFQVLQVFDNVVGLHDLAKLDSIVELQNGVFH